MRNRTTAGFTFVLLPYVIVAFSALTLISDVDRGRWVNAALAGLNAVLAAYAIVSYIGVGNSIVDVWNNVLSWLYKPQRAAPTTPARTPVAVAETASAHWSLTLTYASPEGVRRADRRSPRASGFTGEGRRASDRRASDRRAPDSAPAPTTAVTPARPTEVQR